jgi:arylsulfatase A-like enzyme
MRQFIILTAILTLPLLALAQDRPNFIVILTDDQGWGDLSVNGNTNLETPNIDSLARDGASFDRFYVCPVCSPTRAEFLTGRYHPRSGVYSTSAGGERMDLDEKTIADTFKAGGYATAAFGKWHNGMQYPYHPNGRGFDEFYGFCSGHWGNYFSPPLEHNGKVVKGDGFVVNDFTDKAMNFIEENKDKPFFVYLPYNTPHSPMQVPDHFWDKFKDKELKMHNREPKKESSTHLKAALAMCENIDWNVGRLLKKLDDLQLSDNTVVVYFCDNGPNGVRWNGDMKGKKGSTDEGGVRSPMLIRWPAKINKGRKVTQIGAAIDLLPTFADMAGIKVVSTKKLDGINLSPLLTGQVRRWPDRVLAQSWKTRSTVRNLRFRMDTKGNLFDIAADPGQRKNVADEHPQVAAQLKAELERYRTEVMGELPETDDRPFVIAHPGHQFTQIPARDAKGSGGIKRSNKFPNCSFLSNWTSTDETITWEAEVGASGNYEVELHYACPAKDIGSAVELSFNDSKLRTKISEAHESPLKGKEHDRHPRIESYVKDWKTVNMGTIELKKGTGTLALKALEIPGSQVMEFRLLLLKRVP